MCKQVPTNIKRGYLQTIESDLSVRVKCSLLSLNRSNIYYQPRPVKADEAALKELIFNIWNAHNEKGYRMITKELFTYHDYCVNRKRVKRIMNDLGICGILPKRNLSKNKNPQYKFPYMLKNMEIYRANLVWSTDITYIKLPCGFMYLTAIMDVYSRKILGVEISNTLDTTFCTTCLQSCIAKYGSPVVMNTDQGSQYTSHEWINLLKENDIMISMDGIGRWADNIWIERFWRTLKYDCIIMKGVETVAELNKVVADYMEYYNSRRLHSSLDYKTPDTAFTRSLAECGDEDGIVYCEFELNNNQQKLVA